MSIEQQTNLRKHLNQNQDQIAYFDAIKDLKVFPKDTFVAALYFLAKNLGLNPPASITSLEDLRSVFPESKRAQTGIFWYKGGQLFDGKWYIYYSGTTERSWALDKADGKSNLDEAIRIFKNEPKKNQLIFVANSSNQEDQDYSAAKSASIANLLTIAKAGYEKAKEHKNKPEIIKNVLATKTKEEAEKIYQNSRFSRLKIEVEATNIPANALQDKSLFILWSLVISGLQQRDGKPLAAQVLTALKTAIEKKNIIEAIRWLGDKYFTPNGSREDRNNYIGRQIAKDVDIENIFWDSRYKTWQIVKKGGEASIPVGLLENLFAKIAAAKQYQSAQKQFEQLKEGSKKDFSRLNNSLIGELPFSARWQSEYVNSKQIPFFKEAQDWLFFKLKDQDVLAYSATAKKIARHTDPRQGWQTITEAALKTILADPKSFASITEGNATLATVAEINQLAGQKPSDEAIVKLINKIGLDAPKNYNNQELKDIRAGLELEYQRRLTGLPLFPPGTATVIKLSKLATDAIMKNIAAKIAALPPTPLGQKNYLKIVIGPQGQIQEFHSGATPHKESLKDRFKRRREETRQGLAAIDPAAELRLRQQEFGDTFRRVKEEIWQRNWGLYRNGKIGLPRFVFSSLGQSVKHLFVDTPYRSVKYGFGIGLALLGLSGWYARRRRGQRLAKKQAGGAIDDIQHGIEKTQGFIKRFTGFLKKIPVPGKGKTLFGVIAGALSLRWLFPELDKKVGDAVTGAANTVLGPPDPLEELTAHNTHRYLNGQPLTTRLRIKGSLTLKPGKKIVIPPLATKDKLRAVRFFRNAEKAFLYFPAPQIPGLGQTRTLISRYLMGKSITIEAKMTPIVLPAGTILPKGTIISPSNE